MHRKVDKNSDETCKVISAKKVVLQATESCSVLLFHVFFRVYDDFLKKARKHICMLYIYIRLKIC